MALAVICLIKAMKSSGLVFKLNSKGVMCEVFNMTVSNPGNVVGCVCMQVSNNYELNSTELVYIYKFLQIGIYRFFIDSATYDKISCK